MKKRKASSDLPPLPANFHSLYATNKRASTVDDPALHGGRKRQVPHTEGNWPTHVYIEWRPNDSELENLQSLIDAFAKQSKVPITSLLTSDLDAPLPLHISLSRSLQVPTEGRDELLSAVTDSITNTAVKSFPAEASRLKWVPNYDKTRWFLSLALKRPPYDELKLLLVACNKTAKAKGYPMLYTRPNSSDQDMDSRDYTEFFHFSLAWSLASDIDAKSSNAVLDDIWKNSEAQDLDIMVDTVLAKIGNAIHSIKLGSRASRS
ncbi:hypothetical protein BT63DRAFT_435931 [Microthyrium microscopicum]|uniref:U6 snRNA phosphodiesterase n=1 Tax=Microthyrium microscopicum TaxID=703497 RepID=A0A6A6UT02_9PEZI|nr:hypothetical protein BT63DRAFT_435931 [Microthyrium microscopicum]